MNTNTFSRVALAGCAGLTMGILGAASCLAIDYQPGDGICYWNNTDFGAEHATLSQDSTFSGYVWLSLDIGPVLRTRLSTNISIGYAGIFGGVQKLDGINTGQKTAEKQIRFSYLQFVTPTWQF